MTELLVEFAEKELKLHDKLPDGSTLAENLESVWRQTGHMPPELEPSDLPEELVYLWGYFLSMNARRSGNGYSANPISNQEILAWQRRYGISLSSFENEVIDRFEHAYLKYHAPKVKNEH